MAKIRNRKPNFWYGVRRICNCKVLLLEVFAFIIGIATVAATTAMIVNVWLTTPNEATAIFGAKMLAIIAEENAIPNSEYTVYFTEQNGLKIGKQQTVEFTDSGTCEVTIYYDHTVYINSEEVDQDKLYFQYDATTERFFCIC